MKDFYSNGKLLLTGEYAVLDGALALGLPTSFGQSLTIEAIDSNNIHWKSIDHVGNIWFEKSFNIEKGIALNSNKDTNPISVRLIQILNAAKTLNPSFLDHNNGFTITTKLDFPTYWGLGTSSTLINNIANWANIDAYALLDLTFGGSGYDIACAQYNNPITYQLEDGKKTVSEVSFNPNFKDQLYFVHLNKKQNSREAIARYKKRKSGISKEISEINAITNHMLKCDNLGAFESLINTHEQLISKIVLMEPIKKVLFNDFNGAIKSLGAWGGDFILATSKDNPDAYFKAKGYTTILKYTDIIL